MCEDVCGVPIKGERGNKMNFVSFYGKCNKCGKVDDLFEELIPIPNEPKSFKIGGMFCKECSNEEPRSILNRVD